MSLVKTPEQINKVEQAAKIVAKVHKTLKKLIKPGIKLIVLDKEAKNIIEAAGAIPTFLGYEGFPNSICTSVNEIMVHGIPSDYELKEGDIISVDVGAKLNGYCGDAAFTMGVGKISPRAEELLDTSKKALAAGIESAKPGVKIGDLGQVIEDIVKSKGFNVPRDFVGHGIGTEMHEDPYIPNYGRPDQGIILKEGMTICIEPMLIDGEDDLFIDPIDGWTVRPKHGGLTSHDEHTIVIEKEGGRILSK